MSARPPLRVRIRKTLSGRGARAICALSVLIALGAIALAHPTPAWASVFVSAAALLPLAMIVCARYGSAEFRPARYGFAICCGGYFLFFTFFADGVFLESLATTKAIDWWHGQLFPDATYQPAATPRYGGFGGGGAFDVRSSEDAKLNGEATGAGKNPADSDPFAADGAPSPAPPQLSVAPQYIGGTQVIQQEDRDVAEHFWVIGQSLWALFFGWAGGGIAALLARHEAKRRGATGESASASTTPPTAIPN